MIFMLIHKENKIIKALYELQQLQEKKDELLQKKKELMLLSEKEQQLSSIQNFAQNNLLMTPITLKDVHTIKS